MNARCNNLSKLQFNCLMFHQCVKDDYYTAVTDTGTLPIIYWGVHHRWEIAGISCWNVENWYPLCHIWQKDQLKSSNSKGINYSLWKIQNDIKRFFFFSFSESLSFISQFQISWIQKSFKGNMCRWYLRNY